MKKIKLEGIYKLGCTIVRFALKLHVDNDNNILNVKIKAPNSIYDNYFTHDCLYTESGQKLSYDIYPIFDCDNSKNTMDAFKLENLRYSPVTGAILYEYGSLGSFYQVITTSVNFDAIKTTFLNKG